MALDSDSQYRLMKSFKQDERTRITDEDEYETELGAFKLLFNNDMVLLAHGLAQISCITFQEIYPEIKSNLDDTSITDS
jgi:hypothetical protein